ncbi:PAS domain-containing sensor histidine kinase [Albitalea terrae]|uniref:histidine kinase n=2 Tax=Piscinibacter terrae TaxID=2496871 RepID=A0A3N7HIR4_9BURK|nr:PAS domain-containing sensor histidine kinase [Albitalea terrae]
MFYRYVFSLELESAMERSLSVSMIVASTVSDSAVIGDYDTIRRTLERALSHSDLASASFIDVRGGVVRVEQHEAPVVTPPGWLLERVADRLYDTNLPIVAGGRDYGVLRMQFAPDRIAGGLWRSARVAMLLAGIGMAAGIVLIRWPLRRWLGWLGRIDSMGDELSHGVVPDALRFPDDAPVEFRRTFDVLSRTATSLRQTNEQLQQEERAREAALAALRKILEELVPTASVRGEAGSGDIDAITRMITQLVGTLQEHTEQLGAIFSLSPDGFVSFDKALCVNYVSPGFSRLTGVDDAQVLGLTEDEFAAQFAMCCMGGAEALPTFEAMRRQEGSGQSMGGRRRTIDLNGPGRRTVELSLGSGQGGAIGQVLHLRDVTVETEVDRLKSEFLSTAAHELRTPMTSIYGFTELMMKRRLSPERQAEVVAIVYRQTGIMIDIVNELLDLARIEARRGKDFRPEVVDVRDIVNSVVAEYSPPADRPGPIVELAAEPASVKVDPSKLGQALRNVVSNAYKYSPQGGEVRVSVVTRRQEGSAQAGITVVDQGIGMTPEQLARVCERFYRADDSGTIPGTGLGMSIVKEIIELLGGLLELSSEAGRGTTVTMWLPQVDARPLPSAQPAPAAAA